MAPLSRQAWEKGSVLVQVGIAPAGSSLTTHSLKSKVQDKASPEEAQAACSRCAHTAQQRPCTGSAQQPQPQTHRSISTFSS